MRLKKKIISPPEIDVANATPLIGHSGCDIILLQTVNGARVRKTSKDKEYNCRLKKQCEKQKKFKGLKNVKAPIIYREGVDALGLYFFEMEYINGQTFANYLANSANLNLQNVADNLYSLLAINRSLVDAGFAASFIAKINSLEEQLPSSPMIKSAIQALKNYDWKPELLSPCHGDLTLENIVVSRSGDLYLIDFLDSFCESWIVDMAKLLQDLELQWSFRDLPKNSLRSIRISIVKEAFLQKFLEAPNGPQIVNTAYHTLLLNVLRIIPYSSELMQPYLEDLISKTLARINETTANTKGAD